MNGDKKLPRTSTCDDLLAQAVEAFKPAREETKQLSRKEREVVVLLSHGLMVSEIADYLGRSVNTISTYVQRAHKKIGTTSTTQLAVIWARAEERGLTA